MTNKDTERIDLKDYTANLSADVPARTCIAYITTDTVDEEGESILSRGIQTQRFTKGAVQFSGITITMTRLVFVNGLM